MAYYILEALAAQARQYQDLPFCTFKEPGGNKWHMLSWAGFFDMVEKAACALTSIGVAEASKAIFCTPNRPEALAAELACFYRRICNVPIYAYCSQEQFDFIVSDSGARTIFAGARDQYLMARDYVRRHPHAIDNIILLCDATGITEADDDSSISWHELIHKDDAKSLLEDTCSCGSRAADSDLASLIYTSGTTGNPKGVMLTHANFDAAIREHLKRLPGIKEHELSLSFLPMSHVFEKAWTYFCVVKGLRIAFNFDPRKIEESLHEVHPNIMCCVPRFWEKIYTAIVQRIQNMNPLNRLMVTRAMHVGATYNLHYRRLGIHAPWRVRKEYALWDKLLFSKVRDRIGIPSSNFFPTAGAALSDKICGFMRKIGIDLIFGYGMTETTATVSCYPNLYFQIGTVGTPMPMVKVKIADDGEILIKGPTVTPGYYNNPQANAEAFTSDGYFHSGDAGYINDQGALVLTHRKKDLFKTSNGKYIAPQVTEAMLAADPYIDQAAVIGDMRKYVSALIVPDFITLRNWAEKHGILDLKKESLCKNPKVTELYLSRIKELQKPQAQFEHIKRIVLLPVPFSQEEGEITNTLKLRRSVIESKYKKVIDGMYPEEFLSSAPLFNNRHR